MTIDQVSNVAAQPMVAAVPQPPVQHEAATRESSQTAVSQAAASEAQSQKKTGAAAEKELNDAVNTTNRFMQALSRNLQFSVDKDTNTTVVKLVDTQTKDVIRQIPSEEMLSIAKALDKLQGLLIKDKA